MKKKQIEKAMKEAKYSLEFEGFEITKDHEQLVARQINNEITEEEFLEELRKRVKKGK